MNKTEEQIVSELMSHLDELKPSQLMCGISAPYPENLWSDWEAYSASSAEMIWRNYALEELNWSEIAWRVELKRKRESGVRESRLRKVRDNCLELAGVES